MEMLVAPRQPAWQYVSVGAPLPAPYAVTVDRLGPPTGQRVDTPTMTTSEASDSVLALLERPVDIAGQIRDACNGIARDTDFTREQVARLIGVDRRSITGWVNGSTKPTPQHVQALQRLRALVELLRALGFPSATTLLLDDKTLSETVAWVQHGTELDLPRLLGHSPSTTPDTVSFVVKVTAEQGRALKEALGTMSHASDSVASDDADESDDEEAYIPSSLVRDPRRFAPDIRPRPPSRAPDGHIRTSK